MTDLRGILLRDWVNNVLLHCTATAVRYVLHFWRPRCPWSGNRHHTCTEAERPLLSTAGGTLRSLLCPLVPDVPPWPILSDETKAAIPSRVPSRIRLWRAEDALALAPDDGMSAPAPTSSAVTFGTRFCTTSDLERLEGCTMTFGTARPLGIAAPVRDASLVWDASNTHSLSVGAWRIADG